MELMVWRVKGGERRRGGNEEFGWSGLLLYVCRERHH